jgi:hypothetical protein
VCGIACCQLQSTSRKAAVSSVTYLLAIPAKSALSYRGLAFLHNVLFIVACYMHAAGCSGAAVPVAMLVCSPVNRKVQ